MIESRCGLLCSQCGYREQMDCPGCVHMSKPFWGESCPVKSCCEGKEHRHCGECASFPCDGKRIEQCKCWSAEASTV